MDYRAYSFRGCSYLFSKDYWVSLSGFTILEFFIYSVIMELLIGVLLLSGIHMYVWREQMIIPLLERLQCERLFASMERELALGPLDSLKWNCGEGIVGWINESHSVFWRVRKGKLWYEYGPIPKLESC